ncbi:MAG TPA: DUF5320 domain-containing protein [Candidatus Eremiobacteraeota bacterium]|nr:MAG: hypothetical protein BWY64_02066 [bacterium ADurb.Bin363]HPZ07087.1 DUF5320 domain-containing protein [Candidatus Eremiobacteraeota bacterium]
MPGFDGTGPQGMGPRTGGGRGYCPPPPYDYPGFGAGIGGRPWGGGRGRLWGGGRGRRFSYRWQWEPGYYEEYAPYYKRPGPEEEKVYLNEQVNFLKDQISYLQEQLQEINKRLDELNKTE